MIPGRIFDDLLGVEKTPASRSMLCDISEDDNAYYLELEIPGFAKDDIKIEYDKGILKIVAELQEESYTTLTYGGYYTCAGIANARLSKK